MGRPVKSAGKRLVELLTKQLPPKAEWSESEVATLALIEAAEDRRHLFAGQFDAESDPVRSVKLAAELRLLESHIARLMKGLVPEPDAAAGGYRRPVAVGGPTRRDPRSHRRVSC